MSLTAHPSSSSRPISNSTPKQGPPPPPSRLQYVQLAPSASHLERSPLSVSHSSRAPVPVLKSLLTYSTRPFTFFLALSTLHLHSAAESRSLLDLEHNILHPFPVFPSYIYFSHSLERFLSCFVKPCGGKEKKYVRGFERILELPVGCIFSRHNRSYRRPPNTNARNLRRPFWSLFPPLVRQTHGVRPASRESIRAATSSLQYYLLL